MLCAPCFHINWVFFWCATIVLFKWIEARLWASVGDTKHVNWIYTITNIACTTDHKWYKCALSVSAMPYTKHWASMKRMKDWIWYVNGWRNLLSTLYSCMANAVVDIDVSCLQFFFYATFFFVRFLPAEENLYSYLLIKPNCIPASPWAHVTNTYMRVCERKVLFVSVLKRSLIRMRSHLLRRAQFRMSLTLPCNTSSGWCMYAHRPFILAWVENSFPHTTSVIHHVFISRPQFDFLAMARGFSDFYMYVFCVIFIRFFLRCTRDR